MTKRRVVVVMPGSGWDHFPRHYRGAEASAVLAAWTVPWHPILLQATQSLPDYFSAEAEWREDSSTLTLVPEIEELAGWTPRLPLEFNGPTPEYVVRITSGRRAMTDRMLSLVGGGTMTIDAELVADFQALGYHHLQTQLLTRRMHHGGEVDAEGLREVVVRAAESAVAGDVTAARDRLRDGFTRLHNERTHYYPVDTYFVETVLCAEPTVERILRLLTETRAPVNLWFRGVDLGGIASLHSETPSPSVEKPEDGLNSVILGRLRAKTLGLLGGEWIERELSLLPSTAIVRELRRGRRASQDRWNRRPTVFLRRRFGLNPRLADLLRFFRYEGVFLTPLDRGQFPQSPQARTQWYGLARDPIEALGAVPLDADQPETFLRLAQSIARSMEQDYVSTIWFVRRLTSGGESQEAHEYLQDLRRGLAFGPIFGRWVTALEYFEKSTAMGQRCDFTFDQFRSPYLNDAVARGESRPISYWLEFWRDAAALHAASTLLASAWTLEDAPVAAAEETARIDRQIHIAWEKLLEQETLPSAWRGDRKASPGNAVACLEDAAGRLLNAMRFQPGSDACFLNPFPCNHRHFTSLPTLPVDPQGAGIYATGTDDSSGSPVEAVVDLPAGGFTSIGLHVDRRPSQSGAIQKGTLGGPAHAVAKSRMTEDMELRNEFLWARVDPTSGGLAALHDYQARDNRLSLRLVYLDGNSRFPSGGPGEVSRLSSDAANSSQMLAKGVSIIRDDGIVAEIRAEGALVDAQSGRLAEFQVTYRLVRGSRELWLDIDLDSVRDFGEAGRRDPWRNYLAVRTAWRGGEAPRAWCQDAVVATRGPRFEAPLYYQLGSGDRRTTVYTPGLPYHARPGDGRADTLLLAGGETARRFRVGLGVDSRNPWQVAFAELCPPTLRPVTAHGPPQGWFFRLDQANVAIVDWIIPTQDGAPVPRSVRLQCVEFEGRMTRVALRVWRPLLRARKLDADHAEIQVCEIRDGFAVVNLRPHEWTELELNW